MNGSRVHDSQPFLNDATSSFERVSVQPARFIALPTFNYPYVLTFKRLLRFFLLHRPTLCYHVLKVMSSKMTLGGDVDFQQIAKRTPGFVGADLCSLTKEAAVVAINRIFTRLRASPACPSTPPTVVSPGGLDDKGDGSSLSPIGTINSAKSNPGLPTPGGQSTNAEDRTIPNDPAVAVNTAPDETAESTTFQSNGSQAGHTHDGKAGNSLAASKSSKLRGNASGGPPEIETPDAMGGFLAGPLSPAQLAPLSVTMEDFLAAVKKVTTGKNADGRAGPSSRQNTIAFTAPVSFFAVSYFRRETTSDCAELGSSCLVPFKFYCRDCRHQCLGLGLLQGCLIDGRAVTVLFRR